MKSFKIGDRVNYRGVHVGCSERDFIGEITGLATIKLPIIGHSIIITLDEPLKFEDGTQWKTIVAPECNLEKI